jgi:hypothetical protein
MNSVPIISRWREGRVDRTREHFELRYESTVKFESDWSDWIPVAIVGPPKAHIVNVQFLVEPGNPKNVAAVTDVKKEIQFYLIDKGSLALRPMASLDAISRRCIPASLVTLPTLSG